MKFHTDCRFYRPDRPCKPHKEGGHECESCELYDPVSTRILMVKLGAMGDVLRTTALLDPLRRAWPNCAIEWLTRPESRGLLTGVVDRILLPEPATTAELASREFDGVINLDLSRDSAALATLARARKRLGFELRPDGAVVPCDDRGRTWYEMSLNDRLKRENTRTYQDHMLDILGLEPPPGEILVRLTEEDRRTAAALAREHGLDTDRPVMGLNIGAGGRWRWKEWLPERFAELARRLVQEQNARVILLHGPDEEGLAADIIRRAGLPLIDAGGRNPIRQFMGIVDLCDLVVTGDTLALHIAAGLRKQVVALFGPTSAPEIEMYNRGDQLAGHVDCLCCYLNDCDVRPSCMETITVEEVLAAVLRWLEHRESTKETAAH